MNETIAKMMIGASVHSLATINDKDIIGHSEDPILRVKDNQWVGSVIIITTKKGSFKFIANNLSLK